MSADPQATYEAVLHLHERAVEQLVESHVANEHEPLVLAVRFGLDDPMNIHLLEVLAEFPGGDDDEPFATEFDRSANLRILGKLHLTMCNAAQLRAALGRGDPLIDKLRRGIVLHHTSEGQTLERELGLSAGV